MKTLRIYGKAIRIWLILIREGKHTPFRICLKAVKDTYDNHSLFEFTGEVY